MTERVLRQLVKAGYLSFKDGRFSVTQRGKERVHEMLLRADRLKNSQLVAGPKRVQ